MIDRCRRGPIRRYEEARDWPVKRVVLTVSGLDFRAGAQLAHQRYLTAVEQAEVMRGMGLPAEGARRGEGDGRGDQAR